jgi:sucrose-6-phosphate hydrolase SacC (GH32 family)
MDGRRISIAWMSNWDYATKVPTNSWRSGATLPRVLELKKTKRSYLITALPAKELEKLRGQKSVLEPGSASSGMLLTEVKPGQPLCYELELEVDLAKTTANKFSMLLSNPKGERYEIGYDITLKRFFSDRRYSGDLSFSEAFAKGVHVAPRHLNNNLLSIRLYLDVASAELFADHGETCITDLFFPSEGFTQIRLNAVGGTVWIKSGVVHHLKSIY